MNPVWPYRSWPGLAFPLFRRLSYTRQPLGMIKEVLVADGVGVVIVPVGVPRPSASVPRRHSLVVADRYLLRVAVLLPGLQQAPRSFSGLLHEDELVPRRAGALSYLGPLAAAHGMRRFLVLLELLVVPRATSPGAAKRPHAHEVPGGAAHAPASPHRGPDKRSPAEDVCAKDRPCPGPSGWRVCALGPRLVCRSRPQFRVAVASLPRPWPSTLQQFCKKGTSAVLQLQVPQPRKALATRRLQKLLWKGCRVLSDVYAGPPLVSRGVAR